MVLIGLGGNLPSPAGPPPQTFAAALAALGGYGCRVVVRSPLYRTAPVPISDQPWFVNAVAQLATGLGPEALLAALLAVEARFGRQRGVANAARTLDLDLLAYDEICRDGPGLTLPHPRLHLRAFVLRPLVDLAPDWRHPRLGRTARELLAALPPGETVEPMPVTPPNP
jgi:2-amino-4-hydroxy-6-hydroxymethyldihydropteridine diphosphokinase